MLNRVILTMAVSFAVSAAAQESVRPDPADPKSARGAPTYESAFKGYRPFADPEVGRWRQSNEDMGRLKGHLGHVPKAQSAADQPAGRPPAQSGHGSHK